MCTQPDAYRGTALEDVSSTTASESDQSARDLNPTCISVPNSPEYHPGPPPADNNDDDSVTVYMKHNRPGRCIAVGRWYDFTTAEFYARVSGDKPVKDVIKTINDDWGVRYCYSPKGIQVPITCRIRRVKTLPSRYTSMDSAGMPMNFGVSAQPSVDVPDKILSSPVGSPEYFDAPEKIFGGPTATPDCFGGPSGTDDIYVDASEFKVEVYSDESTGNEDPNAETINSPSINSETDDSFQDPDDDFAIDDDDIDLDHHFAIQSDDTDAKFVLSEAEGSDTETKVPSDFERFFRVEIDEATKYKDEVSDWVMEGYDLAENLMDRLRRYSYPNYFVRFVPPKVWFDTRLKSLILDPKNGLQEKLLAAIIGRRKKKPEHIWWREARKHSKTPGIRAKVTVNSLNRRFGTMGFGRISDGSGSDGRSDCSMEFLVTV